MSERVDLLFGVGGEPPGPRNGRVALLLALALPLDLAGVLLPTSILGLLPTLWAWHLASEDLHRVRRGEIPPERAGALPLLHQVSVVLLGWCGLTYVIQVGLLVSGMADELVARWVGGG